MTAKVIIPQNAVLRSSQNVDESSSRMLTPTTSKTAEASTRRRKASSSSKGSKNLNKFNPPKRDLSPEATPNENAIEHEYFGDSRNSYKLKKKTPKRRLLQSPTTTAPDAAAAAATTTPKSTLVKRRTKQTSVKYSFPTLDPSGSSSSSCSATTTKTRIPVVMLPRHTDLSTIPEDGSIDQGFEVTMHLRSPAAQPQPQSQQPNVRRSRLKRRMRRQRFSGLVSLTDGSVFGSRTLQRSAATIRAIEIRVVTSSSVPVAGRVVA